MEIHDDGDGLQTVTCRRDGYWVQEVAETGEAVRYCDDPVDAEPRVQRRGPRTLPMPYTKFDEQAQRDERARRMRFARSDWNASVEDIEFEHQYFGNDIPFSADHRPLIERST